MRTVTMKDGSSVREDVLHLLWRLESDGIDLTIDGPDLVIRPKGSLSPDDVAFIQAHRQDVYAVVTMCEALQ